MILNKNNITKNIRWLFLDKAIQIFLGVFTFSLLARHLGTEEYGAFSYSMALVGVLQPLSNLGLNSIVIRELSCHPEKINKILGTTAYLNLIGAFLSLFLVLISVSTFHHYDFILLSLVAILASANIFNGVYTPIDLWLQSHLQSKYTVYSNNFAYVLYFFVNLVLIYFGFTSILVYALAKFLISPIKTSCLTFFYSRLKNSIWTWSFNLKIAFSLLRESWPLILSTFAISIYLKIDQVMLGQMTSSQEVAIYSVAAQISETFYFIPIILLNSFAPAIYQAKKKLDEADFYKKLKILLCSLSIISILVSSSISVISPSLIKLLFGASYVDSIQVLQIHAWTSIFVFSGTGASCWFIAEEVAYLTVYRTLLGALSNIALNLYLIPKYNSVGAAMATVISYAIGSLIANAFHPKTRKIFWLQVNSIFLNYKYCI